MSSEHAADFFEECVAVRPRHDLTVVALSGDDQRSWLNGQVTNDVRHTTKGQGVYCLAVTVRGKIMADAWVLDRGEQFLVLLPEASRETVLESFESQIIMEDVELSTEVDTRVISVQGPGAVACVKALEPGGAEVFACDELGRGGRFVLCAAGDEGTVLEALSAAAREAGGGMVDDAAFELARLRAGRPRFGTDYDQRHYPQEAGLKARAVSFEKGCYLGQEVVCTLENRGKLNKRLMQLRTERMPTEVPAGITDAEGNEIGELTSAALDPASGQVLALGFVKTKAAGEGDEVRVGDLTVRVQAPAG
ncbi:MAG: glycine cleavage T C-terminal barrel domain-containing protein [Myxococcales bacterium]|jgi:folate-binding protein YgfZ